MYTFTVKMKTAWWKLKGSITRWNPVRTGTNWGGGVGGKMDTYLETSSTRVS